MRAARTVVKASDRPLWLPGSTPPEWLDGTLPGDFGYDPLKLGKDPETLRWCGCEHVIVQCVQMLGFLSGMERGEYLIAGVSGS